MTRRLMKNNINNEDDSINTAIKQNSSGICNGHTGRAITRQTSQELLKVMVFLVLGNKNYAEKEMIFRAVIDC